MAFRQLTLAVLTLAGTTAVAQPALYLKARTLPAGATEDALTPEEREAPQRTTRAGRAHYLVQFNEQPTIDDEAALKARGARILHAIPDFAFLIASDQPLDLGGLELARFEQFRKSDKLSPALFEGQSVAGEQERDPQRGSFLVYFHHDVNYSEERTVLGATGARVTENNGLPDHVYGVKAELTDILDLADWDEVAYITPASEVVTSGEKVHFCTGAMMVGASGGTYPGTNLRGPGWSVNRTPTTLGFFVQTYEDTTGTSDLTDAEVDQQLARARNEWSRVIALTWEAAASATANRTITINHNITESGFGAAGGVLGLGAFPPPWNAEPVAGDVWMDNAETWVIGSVGGIDYFTVMLHEIGHAIGLDHSDNAAAVMAPTYQFASNLHPDDVARARSLYPAPGEVTSGGGTTGGTSGSGSTTDTTAPTVTITSPSTSSVSVTSTSITVRGSATDNSGIREVSWVNSTGGSGVAQGTSSWSAGVPLRIGVNTITIRARDTAGNQAWRTLSVTRR